MALNREKIKSGLTDRTDHTFKSIKNTTSGEAPTREEVIDSLLDAVDEFLDQLPWVARLFIKDGPVRRLVELLLIIIANIITKAIHG